MHYIYIYGSARVAYIYHHHIYFLIDLLTSRELENTSRILNPATSVLQLAAPPRIRTFETEKLDISMHDYRLFVPPLGMSFFSPLFRVYYSRGGSIVLDPEREREAGLPLVIVDMGMLPKCYLIYRRVRSIRW